MFPSKEGFAHIAETKGARRNKAQKRPENTNGNIAGIIKGSTEVKNMIFQLQSVTPMKDTVRVAIIGEGTTKVAAAAITYSWKTK